MDEYKTEKTFIIDRANVLILEVCHSVSNEPGTNERSQLILANKQCRDIKGLAETNIQQHMYWCRVIVLGTVLLMPRN